jgi:hypothetical protein
MRVLCRCLPAAPRDLPGHDRHVAHFEPLWRGDDQPRNSLTPLSVTATLNPGLRWHGRVQVTCPKARCAEPEITGTARASARAIRNSSAQSARQTTHLAFVGSGTQRAQKKFGGDSWTRFATGKQGKSVTPRSQI